MPGTEYRCTDGRFVPVQAMPPPSCDASTDAPADAPVDAPKDAPVDAPADVSSDG